MIGFIHVLVHESRGVPDFRREKFIALELFIRKRKIRSGRTHAGECETNRIGSVLVADFERIHDVAPGLCLLYTSDAADERSSVDLGGRRIIKKKKKKKKI